MALAPYQGYDGWYVDDELPDHVFDANGIGYQNGQAVGVHPDYADAYQSGYGATDPDTAYTSERDGILAEHPDLSAESLDRAVAAGRDGQTWDDAVNAARTRENERNRDPLGAGINDMWDELQAAR
jgi:hypothetical protein